MSASGERSDGISNVASRTVALANPAAGADWSYTVTQVGLLVAAHAILATSAVVANRVPNLSLFDAGGNVMAEVASPSAQTAGITWRYSWFGGTTQEQNNGRVVIPLPLSLVLGVGFRFAIATSGLDVGDQWSNIVLTFSA